MSIRSMKDMVRRRDQRLKIFKRKSIILKNIIKQNY